jgi:hypothetical protein
VYFVEGHNFHVEWHWRFGLEMREKGKSTPRVTIHRRPENSQLGMRIVHNWLRKPQTPFVEVVEGWKIYNFPIDHLVHFYFKILSFQQSNRAI